ncbi:phosphatase PAP2 family protein [Salinarchaeum sp. IM2453]|uniref:phosphatase PAP2 family protein n=1 Tax=Salinarchaeum sp. IM2453 TaxID=2862870 RepID=UPI001C8316F4|nr:phosphatase PAP2 family protein [Salinarchaeum sp. IM2453]QZA89139.1 phosphatase PAP2 family protein [Salinarchaeum sp. IM2453]
MNRDLGVTESIRGAVPESVEWIFVLGSLPGELLLVVAVLASLYLGDFFTRVQNIRSPEQLTRIASDNTVAFIAIVFGGLSLIVFLEALFGLSRPPEEWHAVAVSPYSFPSGHTMAATILWGGLALFFSTGKSWQRDLTAGVLIAMVAFSRVGLGVHYLADVIAAILIGALYLGIARVLLWEQPKRSFAVALVFALAAVIFTAASSRSLIAFAGTVGAVVGWKIVELPSIRNRIAQFVVSIR